MIWTFNEKSLLAIIFLMKIKYGISVKIKYEITEPKTAPETPIIGISHTDNIIFMNPDVVATIIWILTSCNPLRNTAKAFPKHININQIEQPISKLLEGTESCPTHISINFAPIKKSIIAEGMLTNNDVATLSRTHNLK